MKITKETCTALRDELTQVLPDIQKKLGILIRVGPMRYNEDSISFTCKCSAAEEGVDTSDEEAVAAMVRAAQTHGSDLVIADYYRVYEGLAQPKSRAQTAGPVDADAFIRAFTDSPSSFYYGVLWNKLYRRDIIIRHNLRMDESLSWCEDLLFNMSYYKHIASAYVLRTPVYYYVRSMTSLSMQKMNLVKLGRIRLKLYAAYRRFALETLTPGAYRAWKPRAVKFFYAGLIDEFVLPGGGKMKFGMRNA